VTLKLFALGLIGVLTAPAIAQNTETGPQGYAEPHFKVPPASAEAATPTPTPDNTLNMYLSTGGTVSIQLRPDKAPKSVERVKILAQRHFYDGTVFHRVIEGFMAQGGDPKGTGEGGSDLPDLKAEFNELPHVRGAMAMARADSEDSANSQFYIMLAPNLQIDRHYTVIGRVMSGMAYVDALERGEPPAHPSKIIHAWIGAPPANPADPHAADAAASAAADAAAGQAAQASLAASEAAKAAKSGDPRTAQERATAAEVAAQAAAQAAGDAAQAAAQGRKKGRPH
jgi:cyclophilin family peptidyl-prolyl cis-trans isomerase